MATQLIDLDDNATASSVSFQDSQGVEYSATLLNLGRYQVAFELCHTACPFRTSEVLHELTLQINGQRVAAGNAVITSVVHTGTGLVCEAKLGDTWLDLESLLPTLKNQALQTGFADFLQKWNNYYRILPEYKGIIADMHTFLADLKLWLEQVELAIRAAPAGDRIQLEQEVARSIGENTTRVIGELFEKYEAVTLEVEKNQAEQRAAHSAFAKRLLHPLLLSSPFLYRTYRKPLGYAGDYEMVNMICREPLEGSSLFAKILNLWFLSQPPAQAHRNRVRWLGDRIAEVTARAIHSGKVARILSVGCGPAVEVQTFMRENEFANHARFTLIDFNQETIEYARTALEVLGRQHQRQTQVQVIKKSVHQIMKEAGRSAQSAAEHRHDLVYCAGLFDYLSDQSCRMLSNILYEWVAPGGLFITTNVDACNPRRLTMDYIMDWHLIYRRGDELAQLRPERVPAHGGSISADETGVNIFYTVSKR